MPIKETFSKRNNSICQVVVNNAQPPLMAPSPLASLLCVCPPFFIHVHDPQNHFKYTDVVTSVQESQRTFVIIDSTECISQRVLFSRIINGLAEWTVEWDDNCESWGGPVVGNWDSGFDAFVHALKQLWRGIQRLQHESSDEHEEEERSEGSMIVILEHCERLKDFVPFIFVPLTRLAELVSSLCNSA